MRPCTQPVTTCWKPTRRGPTPAGVKASETKLGLHRGESHDEAGAAAELALDLDLPVVLLDDVADDRESQAGAAGLPGACPVDPVEALEDAAQVLPRDARAGVRHLDHGRAVLLPQADRDLAVGGVPESVV